MKDKPALDVLRVGQDCGQCRFAAAHPPQDEGKVPVWLNLTLWVGGQVRSRGLLVRLVTPRLGQLIHLVRGGELDVPRIDLTPGPTRAGRGAVGMAFDGVGCSLLVISGHCRSLRIRGLSIGTPASRAALPRPRPPRRESPKTHPPAPSLASPCIPWRPAPPCSK